MLAEDAVQIPRMQVDGCGDLLHLNAAVHVLMHELDRALHVQLGLVKRASALLPAQAGHPNQQLDEQRAH
ncbi:hypothetical protein D1872_351470 [compost metagenome]